MQGTYYMDMLSRGACQKLTLGELHARYGSIAFLTYLNIALRTPMNSHRRGPSAEPLTLSFAFTPRLPPLGMGECLFVLEDGSVCAGIVVRDSKLFKGGALLTAGLEGGSYHAYEIPLRQVTAYAAFKTVAR